jgi:hypothetical protein
MQTEQDAAVTEEILDETPEPVAGEQADIAATAEKETESPEENDTPSAGDPEQEDQESDSEEATNEPSEEAPEAPDNEADDDAKAQVKSRTKKRIETLLTKTKEKDAELEKLRSLLAKQSQPPPQEAPKAQDFTAEETQAASAYNRAMQEGASEAEQSRLYNTWLQAREKRVVQQAKQETLEYFHRQQQQAAQVRVQNRLWTKLADISTRHPFIKETADGSPPVDWTAPIVKKAMEIAAADGVPVNDWGTFALYMDEADRSIPSPVVNRAKKAENRVKEITERTGIEPGHRAPPPKVNAQAKKLKDLERRAEQGDTDAMEALLAHSVTKYL